MLLKKLGTIFIILFLFSAFANAQENVLTLDPLQELSSQIIADTTANNGILPARVYELQRGQFYLQNAIFNVPAGSTLRFRASAGDGTKPVVYLDIVAGTGRPPGNWVVLNGGNLELKDICVVGYFEDFWDEGLAGIQGGLIQTGAVGSSIVIDGAVLSNTNGNHIRTNAATSLVKVTNSIFGNMGALTRSNFGAGKGIDLRDVAHDSVIFVNNTFVNYQDRVIRHLDLSAGGTNTGAINYLLFDHNTLVNGMGFHGTLSLGNVGDHIIITNNLFYDAFALGEDSTDQVRASEWLRTGEVYPNGYDRMTWVLSVPNAATMWDVSGNFYVVSPEGQAWLDDNHFGHGPFGIGSPLSNHVNGKLGADSVKAFTKVDLTLVEKPKLMTTLMTWYENPAGGNRTKVTTNFNVALHDYDRRKVEYFLDTLDASYPTSSPVYTGGAGGYPAGDLNWFPDKKAEWLSNPTDVDDDILGPTSFSLHQNYPNPFNPVTKISFNLDRTGHTVLSIYNILGQKVSTLFAKELPAGPHEINFDASSLTSGVYLYKLESGANYSVKKMILMK